MSAKLKFSHSVGERYYYLHYLCSIIVLIQTSSPAFAERPRCRVGQSRSKVEKDIVMPDTFGSLATSVVAEHRTGCTRYRAGACH